MGLDNGMLLHSKKQIDVPRELNVAVEHRPGAEYEWVYDILYFRKCWNIRREAREILGASPEYVEKSWLDVTEVKNFWWALNNMNSRKAWDRNNESIWTFDEIHDHLDNSLLALEWLIDFMIKHPADSSYMVEFYDSY